MLLQEIYAREAMTEAGITGTLEIVHAEQPKTIVNGKDYGLLFPKRIFKSQPKDIEMLFIGTHTPQREAFLQQFPGATIIYTDNGRNDSIKGHDSQYWDMMQRAKYVLCPDGDFVWTYRFFEAVACQAMPVIQGYHPIFSPYYNFGAWEALSKQCHDTELYDMCFMNAIGLMAAKSFVIDFIRSFRHNL